MNLFHHLSALLMAGTFTVIFGMLALLRYQAYHPFNQDFTYRLQGFWHYLHFGSFRETVYGVELLRVHCEPIIYGLMPLFRLGGESPELLMLAQVLMLALSGLPLFAAAARWLSPRAALGVLLAYYLYPPLQFGAVFCFTPIAFGAFFVNAALYALLVRNRMRWAVPLLLAAMLCQEVYFYVTVVVGVLWWCRGRARAGLFLALAGGVALLLFVASYSPATPDTPWLRDRHEIATLWYGNTGSQPLAGIIGEGTRTLLQPLTAEYLLRLLGPLALLPLLGPRMLLPLALILLPFCLTQFPFTRQIYTYYQLLPLPFVFWAFLLACRRWQPAVRIGKWPGIRVLLAAVVLLSAGAMLYESPLSLWHRPFIYYPGIYANPRQAVIDAALARIPDGASVLAPAVLSEKMFRRQHLTVVFKENILDPDVEYILFDLRELNWIVDIEWPFVPVWLQSMQELIVTGRYRIEYYRQGIIVLRRDGGPPLSSLPPELTADFSEAFARAFAVLGRDWRQGREPFIYAQANAWPTIYHVYGGAEARLPVIAGAFGLPGIPAFTRLELSSADTPAIPVQQWREPAAYFILTVPLAKLPEGENRLVLRGWRDGRMLDSVTLTLRRDATPPAVELSPTGRGSGEYRLLAADESTPVEVWLTTGSGRKLLTPPLIRKWLGMELIDSYRPVPGGAARVEQILTLTDTAVVEAIDYAGNCRRAAINATAGRP